MYILDRDSGNNLWLSSFDNEIIQYNCSTGTMYLRQPENNIVDGNTVTSSPIIHDNIWMGTDNGISAFQYQGLFCKAVYLCRWTAFSGHYTTGRGSFYDQASNRFYIGARHRLISFTPDITYRTESFTPLFIEKIDYP